MLVGLPAEDGGPGGHGPLSVYVSIVESILDAVTNDGDLGILVVGGDWEHPNTVNRFWDAIASETDTELNDAIRPGDLSELDVYDWEMVAIVTADDNLVQTGPEDVPPGEGITDAKNDELIAAADRLAAFVNDGGGLFVSSQSGLTNPWGFMERFGEFSTITGLEYDSISPTPAGEGFGITTDLNVCCWHDAFSDWPEPLDVLAWRSGCEGLQAAALGSPSAVLEPPAEGICVDLLAGRNDVGGEVCVHNDDDDLFVTYTTVDRCVLTESHLAASLDEPGDGEWVDRDNRWQNRSGNPSPGRFSHQTDHDPAVDTFVYTLPLAAISGGAEPGDELFIGAHAVVECNGRSESAWGDGERFVDRGNWATYVAYEVQ